MFGTLRYDAQNDDTHFIERTTDLLNGKIEGQRPRYSACDKCRAKKQRCGGRRDGCERCIRTSSECVYSFQGKGRGRRRRKITEEKDSSPGTFALGRSKRSPTDKPQQQQTPPFGETTRKRRDPTDGTMSSFLPIDSLDDDVPTSGLMQSDMLPGFDGQSIDDYIDTNYISTLPVQHEFDPDYYFAGHCDPPENTPVDSFSDISSSFEQSILVQSPSDSDFPSYVLGSPLLSPQSFSDGLPSPQPTPQARPATPSSQPSHNKDARSTVSQDDCQCLSTMVVVIEDLETKGTHFDITALDSILMSQKEALARCKSVLNCPTCSLRPEYVLLLGIITERLASLCESTVTRYLDHVNDGTLFREADADAKYHSRRSPMDDFKVSLGSYEIERPEERVRLVQLLIVMQLQSLRRFIEGVANAVVSKAEGKTSITKVQGAEQRLAKLIQKIRQSQA